MFKKIFEAHRNDTSPVILAQRLLVFLVMIIIGQPESTSLYSSNYYVIWNTGYGQWHTLIQKDKCVHYDIGGERLRFHRQILSNCLNLKNELHITHADRFHLRFSWFYKKALNKNCPHLLQHFKSTPLENYEDQSCMVFKTPSGCVANNKFWVGGHQWPDSKQTATCQHLASLGHHGSSRFIKQKNIHHWLQYKMLVTTKMYRKGHHDPKTEQLFAKHHRKLIYSYKWGHLIFQMPP